jgi:hypothetical protein
MTERTDALRLRVTVTEGGAKFLRDNRRGS